ncbi:SURF1 family cytochrome oxidase biogenesis protein [Leucobacter sp. W1153]|uniref:SURF1 family cytochrome oxidase biogenesis protein n=1 Tax=unclassified Leucobacter TaxID=2621730 RepID=UPI003F34BC11
MRRPQWIGALLLALVVAAAFAWLGQWQMSFAIQAENDDAASSEISRPISEVTDAGTSVADTAAGMVVSTSGALVPGDFRIVEQRMHGEEQGVWVSGHLVTEDGHLAVAIGWARTDAEAARAIAALEDRLASQGSSLEVEGRYMPPDGAVLPRGEENPMRIASMAPAQLVNLWQPFEGSAYGGFLVMHPGEGEGQIAGEVIESLGLITIESVPPLPVEKVNWLNLFYAVEWVVFAGFAIYFWYRLARDAWEKEHELQLLAAAGSVTHSAGDHGTGSAGG